MQLSVHRLIIFDRHYQCRLDHSWTDPNKKDPKEDHPPDQVEKSDARRRSIFAQSLLSKKTKEPLVSPTTTNHPATQPPPTLAPRQLAPLTPHPQVSLSMEDSRQLILGLTYSLQCMFGKVAVPGDQTAKRESSSETAFSYQTDTYRLLYFESSTRWRFIMLIDAGAGAPELSGLLRHFYATVFVEAILRSPLMTDSQIYPARAGEDQRLAVYAPFDRPGFLYRVDAFILAQPYLTLPSKEQ